MFVKFAWDLNIQPPTFHVQPNIMKLPEMQHMMNVLLLGFVQGRIGIFNGQHTGIGLPGPEAAQPQ